MNRSASILLVTLLLGGCVDDPKGAPEPPELSHVGSADAITDEAVVLGTISVGQTVTERFQGETYLAYELRVTEPSVVDVSLASSDGEGDPVLFLYGPDEGVGGLVPVATNDDVDYPADLSSRIASAALAAHASYLVVLRDYRHGVGGFELSLQCASGQTCGAPPVIESVLRALGDRCGELSTSTECGLAVTDLRTGDHASYGGDAYYVSASSPKFFWVAAALYHGATVDEVAPLAIPIFEVSDNTATGQVIGLLPSAEAINEFMDGVVGARGTCFRHWRYGGDFVVDNCFEGAESLMDDDNFFTANDSNRFLSQLWRGELLDEERTAALLQWSARAPSSGFSGRIPGGLPESARAGVHHKTGSLPPDTVPGYSISHDIGIVELPEGGAYAVSILMSGNESRYYDQQIPLMRYVSCVIYEALTTGVDDVAPATCHQHLP